MVRRPVYCLLILSLFLTCPGIVWAKGGGSVSGGAGSYGTASGAGDVNEQTRTVQETNNAGESNHVQNQETVQNEENKSDDNSYGACEQLLEQTRAGLQAMQQNQAIEQKDWASVEENLQQLKNEYRTRTELRQEIWNMFQFALQNASALGSEQNKEQLLREMISLEPQSAQEYKELGTLLQNRGEGQCHLWCNGSEVESEVPPVIRDGRTLVPVRAISEALGAQVEWQQEEQTVLINKGDTRIRLQIQNRTALINGQTLELDVPADIVNSRAFVPLRFCAQAFNADLAYYPEGSIVTVNQK